MILFTLLDSWDAHIHAWAAALGWPGEGLLRLFLAVIAGGVVGLDREIRGRQAGFRTNMLVCLGSALVMIVSLQFAHQPWGHDPAFNINIDPARVAYGVMGGIGFLGAGTIIRDQGAVRGLTTAAALWCVAAIGLGVGFGMYVHCSVAVLLVVVVLWLFDVVERAIPREHHQAMTLRTKYAPGCVGDAVDYFTKLGIRAHDTGFDRCPDPSLVDILLELRFRRLADYTAIVRQIEQEGKYQLISAREVSV
ncbi:MAG TPA: MgtC/SapB family protein [Tepidisphaeraceae bacterium]